MKFYHGTNVYFEHFDLRKSGVYKDFGIGMYLSEKKSHAESVARWKHGNNIYVYTYDVIKTELRNEFNVLEFKTASIEYLKFIIRNRTEIVNCDYDIIIGPTADAKSQMLIEKFIVEHENPTTEDYKKLRDALKMMVYPTQVCLKNNRAICYFEERRVIE